MMTRFIVFSLMFNAFLSFSVYGDTTIWKGEVNANGSPTDAIPLVLHQKYKIKVSGYVNLGKWIQNKEELANDACYDFNFNKETHLEKVRTFRNSNDISVCDGKYHPDHIYQSLPFTAKQNKIHFWVFDTDYENNTGAFQVEIIQISNDIPKSN